MYNRYNIKHSVEIAKHHAISQRIKTSKSDEYYGAKCREEDTQLAGKEKECRALGLSTKRRDKGIKTLSI